MADMTNENIAEIADLANQLENLTDAMIVLNLRQCERKIFLEDAQLELTEHVHERQKLTEKINELKLLRETRPTNNDLTGSMIDFCVSLHELTEGLIFLSIRQSDKKVSRKNARQELDEHVAENKNLKEQIKKVLDEAEGLHQNNQKGND